MTIRQKLLSNMAACFGNSIFAAFFAGMNFSDGNWYLLSINGLTVVISCFAAVGSFAAADRETARCSG
jgi:hypothetical protein